MFTIYKIQHSTMLLKDNLLTFRLIFLNTKDLKKATTIPQ